LRLSELFRDFPHVELELDFLLLKEGEREGGRENERDTK